MPLKNLFLVILITILLTSVFYANLDGLMPFFQKITGYTSIVIYGTVVSPQANATQEPTLTATVTQPQKEEPVQQTNLVSQPELSATVEPSQENKEQYFNETILSQLINQTEDLKVKLDKLRTSSRAVLNYYSSVNDTKNVEKWINVVTLFNQALSNLEDTQNYTENVKSSATKENVNIIKDMIGDIRLTLDKIVKLIKS